MAASPGFYRELLDNLLDGVYFVDAERRITYWNKGAERISGYEAGEVIGSRCSDEILVHVASQGRCLCTDGCPLQASLDDGEIHEAEVFLHHKDGHRVPVQVRVAPVRAEDGRITGAVEAFTDNATALAALQRVEELESIAYVDSLTGVANRALTEITLRAKIDEMTRYGWPFGVIFADIDRFKAVNDLHGHDLGDRVLTAVAKTLAGNSRSFDLVGRWGGEEFLVLVTNVDLPKLRALAERFRVPVANASVSAADGAIAVTISVGAALVRAGDDPASVVKRADAAMYKSKQAGRNRVTVAP